MRKLFILLPLLVALLSAEAHAEFDTVAKQAILIDYATGSVLFEKNADQRMVPSSMTKLMTLYITFQKIKQGSLKMDDTLPVSEKAWRTGGSKMFVEVGNRIKVEDLLKGVAVQSGNDACVVLAEGIAGSEDSFAEMMNEEAKKLGLENSHFDNANGLPEPDHYSSARDLAVLASRIIHDFPEEHKLFDIKEFTYHGITQQNRNPLLGQFGVDGMKTGHTDDGGYGIVISAQQDGRRLVLVLNGMSSQKERAQEAERLIRHGFNDFTVKAVYKKDDKIGEARVWMGDKLTVPLLVESDVYVAMPRSLKDKGSITLNYNDQMPAPLKKGDKMGELLVQLPGVGPKVVPVVAGEDVTKLTGISRLWPAIKYFLFIKK